MYAGLLLGLYKNKELAAQLFFVLFSFNIVDEITGDNGLVNFSDYFDIFIIFVLGFLNYKNLRNENNK